MDEEIKKDEEEELMPQKIKKGVLTHKMRENPWILSTLVLGVLSLILIMGAFSGNITGNVVSGSAAGEGLVSYLNTIADSEVTLVGTEDLGSMYEVTIEYQGQEMPIYVTKDGQNYAPSLVPISSEESSTQTNTPAEVPKSDKPQVELFVMTHCPYGTQAEKGIIPVFELLGDKIDSNVRFVHYFMHEPEEAETPIQICIREEQEEKYLDYLSCFLAEGNTEACLVEAGIDQTKLDECVDKNSAGYYDSDSSLSQGYGVSGSPTLVINGQIVSSSRSPAAYLATICSAFNTAPEECNEVLDSASPSAGFGYGTTSGSTSAQC